MSFAEKLRLARERRNLTQQQVADRMKIDKSTYCGYETGKRQPDINKIKQLTKILEVSGDELLETGFGEVICMPQFRDMLVYLRKREKLSQQQLAEAIGITRSAIGMYETGKREPDLETLEAIADFFNVDMNTLTGSEKPSAGRRQVSKEDIAFALSRGREETITDEMFEEVQNFYHYLVQREENRKNTNTLFLHPDSFSRQDQLVASPVILPSAKKKEDKE